MPRQSVGGYADAAVKDILARVPQSNEDDLRNVSNTDLNANIMSALLTVMKKQMRPDDVPDLQLAEAYSAIKEGFGVAARRTTEQQAKLAIPPVSEMPKFGNTTRTDFDPKRFGIIVNDGNQDVIAWLSAIALACDEFQKSKWLRSLKTFSSGNLKNTINTFCDSHPDIDSIDAEALVRCIEKKHANVISPSAALAKLHRVKMIAGDTVASFHERVRHLVKMAVRDVEVARRGAEFDKEMLRAFWNGIPQQFVIMLREKEETRHLAGLSDYTQQEAFDALERLLELRGITHPLGGARDINNITDDAEELIDTRESTDINKVAIQSDKLELCTDSIGDELGGFVNAEFEDFGEAGIDTTQFELNNEFRIYAVKAKMGKGKDVIITTHMVGVDRNACLKCGATTHFMRGRNADKCPYFRSPLVGQCPKCLKGGHLARECVGKPRSGFPKND